MPFMEKRPFFAVLLLMVSSQALTFGEHFIAVATTAATATTTPQQQPQKQRHTHNIVDSVQSKKNPGPFVILLSLLLSLSSEFLPFSLAAGLIVPPAKSVRTLGSTEIAGFLHTQCVRLTNDLL